MWWKHHCLSHWTTREVSKPCMLMVVCGLICESQFFVLQNLWVMLSLNLCTIFWLSVAIEVK